MGEIIKNDRRIINGWAMFDWANSAYYLVVSTAIFPIYIASVTGGEVSLGANVIDVSVFLSYTVSIAYAIVVIMTPILSGIADYGGRRLYYLRLFTWLGGISCIGLFFFASEQLITLGTVLYMLAAIGAAGGIVFYNAFLPIIATEDKYDSISARGYALGYVGSVLVLGWCLFMIENYEVFGFPDKGLPTRVSFVLVGVWWIVFGEFSFSRLPSDNRLNVPGILNKGLQELKTVWVKVKGQPAILKFLVSFLFYMAGLQTIIYLASIFASVELEMATDELIILILILQIVAIGGAYLFALVSRITGNKISLLIQIGIWMLICLSAYFVTDKIELYIMVGFVGLVLGGVQSLSRSTYAKMIEENTDDTTSYFSFYDVLMKISLVAGSFIFGLVNMITGGMRNSFLALMILFAVGLVLMLTVRDPRIERR